MSFVRSDCYNPKRRPLQTENEQVRKTTNQLQPTKSEERGANECLLQEASYLLSSHSLHWGDEGDREREEECVGLRGRGIGGVECAEPTAPLFLFFPRMHIHLTGHVTCWLPLSALPFRRVSTEHAQSNTISFNRWASLPLEGSIQTWPPAGG